MWFDAADRVIAIHEFAHSTQFPFQLNGPKRGDSPDPVSNAVVYRWSWIGVLTPVTYGSLKESPCYLFLRS